METLVAPPPVEQAVLSPVEQARQQYQEHFSGAGRVKPVELIEHASRQEQFDPVIHRELGRLLITAGQLDGKALADHFMQKTGKYEAISDPNTPEGEETVRALHQATAEIIALHSPSESQKYLHKEAKNHFVILFYGSTRRLCPSTCR